MLFNYKLYGFSVESEWECLHLPSEGGEPEIRIKVLPSEEPEAIELQGKINYSGNSNSFLIDVSAVAQFLISNGREIQITPYRGSSTESINLYLLGSAFSVIVHQRHELLIHASAVVKNGQSIMFAGDSGVGKSTLAYEWATHRGWKLCSDDVCRLSATKQHFEVHPSYPYMKIWEDVLTSQNCPVGTLSKIDAKWGKYRYPLSGNFQTKKAPVNHIFIIEKSDSELLSTQAITGSQKAFYLRKYFYRPQYLETTASEKAIYPQLLQLSNSIPLTLVQRPDRPFNYNSVTFLSNSIENILQN